MKRRFTFNTRTRRITHWIHWYIASRYEWLKISINPLFVLLSCPPSLSLCLSVSLSISCAVLCCAVLSCVSIVCPVRLLSVVFCPVFCLLSAPSPSLCLAFFSFYFLGSHFWTYVRTYDSTYWDHTRHSKPVVSKRYTLHYIPTLYNATVV